MQYTVGIDEAGRGPLAGPVAVGMVAVRNEYDILAAFPGLNDSKKLSEKRRDALFCILQEQMRAGHIRAVVQMVSATHIDQGGIAPAIRSAIARGIPKLLSDPGEGKVWLDGSLAAPEQYEQETVIGGDGIVPAIMLGALAAKVTRDRYMVNLAVRYPQYGFDAHKGYGTRAHIEAIRALGLCEEHRRSFLTNILR